MLRESLLLYCFIKIHIGLPTVETLWLTMHAQKNIHTISDFTKCCYIAMISHVSSRPNWYWTHAVCNLCLFVCLFFVFCLFFVLFFVFVFCFFPKNFYYFSDLETQWPRNPERFCLSLIRYQRDMSQYWRIFNLWFTEKSQLCFRARINHLVFCGHHGHLLAPWGVSYTFTAII